MGVSALNPRRAVFLDRDGVLNRALWRDGKLVPPDSPAELELLPGIVAACAGLRAAGFVLIVVTNQPDVSRGKQQWHVVEAMHRVIRQRVPLDDIRVCYHDDGDGCACRKPKPGLLLQAAQDWSLDLIRSFVVGDRWRDMAAARNAGCGAVMIENGHGQPEDRNACPDVRVHSLGEAADWILKAQIPERSVSRGH